MRVHRTLELTDSCDIEDRTPSRPDVHVWHDAEDPECEDGRSITIKVGGAFGAQTRYVSLSVKEARAFSEMLRCVADFADTDPTFQTQLQMADFLEGSK